MDHKKEKISFLRISRTEKFRFRGYNGRKILVGRLPWTEKFCLKLWKMEDEIAHYENGRRKISFSLRVTECLATDADLQLLLIGHDADLPHLLQKCITVAKMPRQLICYISVIFLICCRKDTEVLYLGHEMLYLGHRCII